MKNAFKLGGVLLLIGGLGACVHVAEGHHNDLDEIAVNTETALRVCGGPGTVEQVTEDGYECKD